MKKVWEDFLVFVLVSDITEKGLATIILETLSSLFIDTKCLRVKDMMAQHQRMVVLIV